jgi:LytS/YehU family sensor histidine kinase
MNKKRFIITEQQFNRFIINEMINEGVFRNICNRLFGECETFQDYYEQFLKLICCGLMTATMAIALITNGGTKLSKEECETLKIEIANSVPKEEWKKVCTDAVVTVYNAVPEQCNKDVEHTASMFKLNLKDVGSHKIVAIERTFMKELGLNYGDVIKIEGTYKGKQDGVYQVQDTMNKRFAGQHKIDILVPNNIKHGGTLPNQFATIYILNNKNDSKKYLDLMSPSLK